MLAKRWALWQWVIFAVFVAGCGTAPTPPRATTTPTAPTGWTLTPYATPTRTPTPLPPSPPPLPTAAQPSPTPWVYHVQKGDTMLGIALRFGVPLEELKQANPGVDPQFLPVGAQLIIPINPDNPAGLPTPTPVPLTVDAPLCAPSLDGGAVCVVTVRNTSAQAVEAVSVWVALEDGEAREAEALNDLLPAESVTAAVVRFAPPAPPQPQAAARLLRALPVDDQRLAERYLPTTLADVTTTIAEGGRAAHVEGQLTVEAGQAQRVWVVAVAYDAQGRAVGARRWEAEAPPQGHPVAFAMDVYSIGPPIAHVVLNAEAHAAPDEGTSAP